MGAEDFSFEIKADASQANAASANVEAGLDRVTAKAEKTGKAIDDAYQDKNGRWRDAEGRFLATGKAAEGAGKSVGDAMTNAGEKARSAGEAVENVHGGMMDLIALGAAYVSGHELKDLADGYTDIGNRLRTVSVDTRNWNGLMTATLSIAQDTRGSWEDVASVYQRLSQVTGGMGLSQKQVLDLTREMSEAAKISGATSREAAMSMGEITHAFETGALTGREYRVLMRDTPAMMHELQVASGKTASEFANMGKHGQVSAQLLMEWFSKAGPAISEKFGATVPTISDSLQKLHNAAENFFGEAGTGSGVLHALGVAAQFVVDHFETFGKIALGVGEALVGLYVIEKVITLVKMLTAAIAANPLGALLTALVIGISLLRQFGDQMSTGIPVWTNVKDTFVTIGDVMRVLWDDVKALGAAIVDFVESAWNKLASAFSDGLPGDGIEFSLRNVLLFIASFVDAGIGLFNLFREHSMEIFGGLAVSIGEVFVDLFIALAHYTELFINKIADGINNISDAILGSISLEKAQQAYMDGKAKGLTGDALTQYAAKGAFTSGPHVGQVDFSMDNPLKGAADSLGTLVKTSIAEAIGTSTVKDATNAYIDSVVERAHDKATARLAGQKGDGTIGTATGDKEAIAATAAQIAASKKLDEELKKVLEQSNPITDAEIKIAHAADVLTRAVGAGKIGFGDAEAALDAYKRKLEDVLHPHDAWVTKMIDAAAAIRLDKNEMADATKLEAYQNEMKQKGLTVTEAQLRQARELIVHNREYAESIAHQQSLLEQIDGPARQYALNMDAIEQLLIKGKVTGAEYERAVEQIGDAYAQATPYGKTFEYGLTAGLHAIRDEVLDVATTIKTTLVNAFASVNTAIVDLVTKGKADWSGMVNSMLADMTRLILKQIEMKLLIAMMPGLAEGATLPGFATGGSFVVGGAGGGTDNQLVAFRATSGERVTVTPQGGNAPGGGGAGTAMVKVINTSDHRRAALEALNTREGEQLVMNVIAKNSDVIRGHVNRR